uniref:Uncharacterized protein n=1 Tax=Mucochytrium quahogii TaxID=96639 RepID=A0A7S2R9G8_9STRA|mmetsp:Transcript_11574/g.25098  ORF Transcript_11574/g.25098 Transcript_11574/m.25098 type:complete len:605 (+) Transcript_11574:136-1950(+)
MNAFTFGNGGLASAWVNAEQVHFCLDIVFANLSQTACSENPAWDCHATRTETATKTLDDLFDGFDRDGPKVYVAAGEDGFMGCSHCFALWWKNQLVVGMFGKRDFTVIYTRKQKACVRSVSIPGNGMCLVQLDGSRHSYECVNLASQQTRTLSKREDCFACVHRYSTTSPSSIVFTCTPDSKLVARVQGICVVDIPLPQRAADVVVADLGNDRILLSIVYRTKLCQRFDYLDAKLTLRETERVGFDISFQLGADILGLGNQQIVYVGNENYQSMGYEVTVANYDGVISSFGIAKRGCRGGACKPPQEQSGYPINAQRAQVRKLLSLQATRARVWIEKKRHFLEQKRALVDILEKQICSPTGADLDNRFVSWKRNNTVSHSVVSSKPTSSDGSTRNSSNRGVGDAKIIRCQYSREDSIIFLQIESDKPDDKTRDYVLVPRGETVVISYTEQGPPRGNTVPVYAHLQLQNCISAATEFDVLQTTTSSATRIGSFSIGLSADENTTLTSSECSSKEIIQDLLQPSRAPWQLCVQLESPISDLCDLATVLPKTGFLVISSSSDGCKCLLFAWSNDQLFELVKHLVGILADDVKVRVVSLPEQKVLAEK